MFIDGARPDVAAPIRSYPLNTEAGWGFMVLTNMLPTRATALTSSTCTAQDREGTHAAVGTRTMTCNNATGDVPFGAIDTPTQGGVASRQRLRQLRVGADAAPKDNSDQRVDDHRARRWRRGRERRTTTTSAPDIAELFPGPQQHAGAIGFRDPRYDALTNGLHTISWIGHDDGRDGRDRQPLLYGREWGRRVASAVVEGAIPALLLDRTPLFVRRGAGTSTHRWPFEPGGSPARTG